MLCIKIFIVLRIVARVQLGHNTSLAKIDVLCSLPAIDIVSAVCVQRPHLVEIQRLGILRILVAPLSVMSVNIGRVIVRVHARNKLISLIPNISSAIPCALDSAVALKSSVYFLNAEHGTEPGLRPSALLGHLDGQRLKAFRRVHIRSGPERPAGRCTFH